MAAAARSGPPDARDARDARIPCPLCGDLIHPIAGKCKHCKADLTAYRPTRPVASAPLPALSPPAAPGNGQIAPAPIALGAPVVPVGPAAYDATQPVLPPRPTAPTHASPSARPAWRSWPIFVIVIAMMAIVAAVVLMVWPARRNDGKRALPPPAPERMNTRTPLVTPDIQPQPPPQPPPSSVDPWSMRPADPQDPGAMLAAPNGPSGASDPDDPKLDPDDAIDPFASPDPRPSHRYRPTPGASDAMELAMMAHLCRKLIQCGTPGAQMHGQARRTCFLVSRMPAARPRGCPAARRCLGRIDALTCQVDTLQVGMLLMQSSDCMEATRC